MGRTITVLTALLAVGLTSVASATSYPAPGKPSVKSKPKGPFHTLTVGKHGKYKTIQAAVDAAKAGDTVKIANGIYKEGVLVAGQTKRYLKIVGNVADPSKVVLEGKGIVGKDVKRNGVPFVTNQDGIMVSGADEITIKGMTAQHYKGNGFFFVNVNGYTADHLHAFNVGTYGIYAFNSIGGSMTNDVGAWNNDSGFYIGQTPPQAKPVRSIVSQRHLVRQRARLLGHEHALRHDHALEVLQQRHRDRARTRCTARSSRRRRTTSSPTTTSSGTTSTTTSARRSGSTPTTRTRPRTRSASASCCSAAARRRSRTTGSSATGSAARACSSSCCSARSLTPRT